MQRQTYICVVAKGTIHHCERDETEEDERLDRRDVILKTETLYIKDGQSTDTRNRVTCELPVSVGLRSRSEDDGQACGGGSTGTRKVD